MFPAAIVALVQGSSAPLVSSKHFGTTNSQML
jgi:hypothetical protein